MDLITLKKKLSTYTSAKGYIKNVSDDVLYEILTEWENWTVNQSCQTIKTYTEEKNHISSSERNIEREISSPRS